MLPSPMRKMFKIVDWKDGPRTLFHGLNGSKDLPIGKWVRADIKMVRDGVGTAYMSGWHVMPSLQDCLDYLSRFKNVRDKAIVSCLVSGTRHKEHSPSPVFLAENILISGLEWSYADTSGCNP